VEELCGPLAIGFQKGGFFDYDFLGEGCAVFSLEKETSAKQRSARILGEITAYDARFNPDLRAGLAAGLTALSEGGVALHEIRWAFVSANAAVAKIQREVLGTRTSATVLTAANQVVGECYSAQGALQAAAVLADSQIKPGESVLLSAAGFDGGISQLVLKKR
jgi:3-oxoacyl-(acyl-carrier-protein) synthase